MTTGKFPLLVPNPHTLRDAVKEVIAQNKRVGYTPSIFIRETKNGEAPDLIGVCEKLINSGSSRDFLDEKIEENPEILTLEDLVVYSLHGRDWQLSVETMQEAKARVKLWDILGGMEQRWRSE